MYFAVFVSILILILLVVAAYYIFKELKKAADFNQEVVVFGIFPFTSDEWSYLYYKEFTENERGKSFFNKYSAVISYSENINENVHPQVVFSSKEIYITDGDRGKNFTVNKLNYFQKGVHLNSIRLLHLSPLKKLEIKVMVNVSDGESTIDHELDYLVPIPQSSLEKIDEILKYYGKIILADGMPSS